MHLLLCCQGSDAFASVWARVVREYRARKVVIQCGRYHPLQAVGSKRVAPSAGNVRTCAAASRSFVVLFVSAPP